MSRASRNARYYARRKELIFSLEERLKTLDEQYQQRIADLEDRLKTITEEYQLFREGRLKTPRARVNGESLSLETPKVEEERKKPLRGKERKNPAPPEFEAWWAIWPHKVGKINAIESYRKAATRATAAEMLEGVRRYVATKPDSQHWLHPATWLNQDRWTDQPAPPVRQRLNGGSNYSGLF